MLTVVQLVGAACGSDDAGSSATTTTRPASSSVPTTAPTTAAPSADKRLFILSDSVMLGAEATVPDALPDWQVTFDGEESRFISSGVDTLRARAGELGPVVMVQLGNNYDGDQGAFAAELDELYEVVGPDRTLILLHVYPIEENRAEVNASMDALAAEHPNVRVADWPAIVDADPSIATSDGLHLKPSGTAAMADFVEQQIDALPPEALVGATTTSTPAG